MEQICNRCGCSSFHYNRARMRMECDMCGTPVADPQQEQRQMQYDRTFSQAQNHLAAGNWKETIQLLKPLINQYPTEKRLYLAILRAATHDFSDIDMNDTGNKNEASYMWDRLVRLNGVTGEMIMYSRKRRNKYINELNAKKNRILIWIYSASFCSVIAGAFFGTRLYLTAVLFLLGLIGCLYKLSSYHPMRILRQLTDDTPDYQKNPFV